MRVYHTIVGQIICAPCQTGVALFNLRFVACLFCFLRALKFAKVMEQLGTWICMVNGPCLSRCAAMGSMCSLITETRRCGAMQLTPAMCWAPSTTPALVCTLLAVSRLVFAYARRMLKRLTVMESLCLDGTKYVCICSDKFGDVHALSVPTFERWAHLLGHTASMITDMVSGR